jgi:hypothetical protein
MWWLFIYWMFGRRFCRRKCNLIVALRAFRAWTVTTEDRGQREGGEGEQREGGEGEQQQEPGKKWVYDRGQRHMIRDV